MQESPGVEPRALFFVHKETCAFLHKRLDIYLSFVYIITTHGDANHQPKGNKMETTTKKINLPSWIPKEDEIDERETTKIEVNGTKITVRFWYHLTTGQRKIIKGYLESGWEKPGRIGRTHIEWDAPSVLKLSKKIPSWEGSVWESIIVEIVA